MEYFSNLKMARKIVLSFALAILMVVASGVIISISLANINRSSEANVNSLRVKESVDDMLASIVQQENALRGFAMLGRTELLDEYRQNVAAYEAAAKEFDQRVKLADQRARFAKLQAEVADLNGRRFAELIRLAERPETRARAQEISGQKQLPVVRGLTAELLARQEQVIEERRIEQASMASIATIAIWGGVAASALAAMLMGWLLVKTVSTPLRDLTDATTTLARGDQASVPYRDRADELGDIAGAVEQFRLAAVERAAADARLAQEQQVVTSTLRDSLSALSAGDLTATISADYPPAYAALKTNFNDALTALRDLIGSVTDSARAIRTGSGEITQASEDLARRTEANAASLEETSAAVTQMDTRLKATAQAATQTVERADGAIATVTSGRSVADEAVQAMTRVSDSAKGIDSVIEGLDKIAFQTRVLAMNAAVEAGRAGEAGRGFAVVADLVSALAMRAEEEAGRARDQLTATQTDIGAAVEMVQRVDAALANITGDVGEVHALLGNIAADNQAQSTAITQISAAIGAMDHSTQQNAAMVEETAAAARNLTGEVAALTEQAARFNTGQGGRAADTIAAMRPTSRARRTPVAVTA